MQLYTCAYKSADIPGPISLHPCAKAIKALDEAGHDYELKTVDGLKSLPWTLKKREEIERLSGQKLVPILVLDDGEVVTGSGTIAKWAKEHPNKAA